MYLNLILAQAEAGGSSFIIMMVAMALIMYFFMIRPQRNRQKELDNMRKNIAVGNAVVTSGGIHGKVKEVKTTVVLIEVADKICITVDKNAIFLDNNEAEIVKQ